MASMTDKPPDPMPCALAVVLLPVSGAHGCHMQNALFLALWATELSSQEAGALRSGAAGMDGGA